MKVQRLLAFVASVFEIVVYCGVITGWSAVVPVLENERYFAANCNGSTSGTCQEQVESLNLVYTIATALAPLLCVFCGLTLDRYGCWVTRTLLVFVISVGFLSISLSDLSSSWVLFIGFSLVNIGGAGLCLPDLETSNLFKGMRSTSLAVLAGSMSTSSLTFLVVNKIYFSYCISFKAIFLFFAFLSLVFHLNTFLLTPKYRIPKTLPDNFVYGYKHFSKKRSINEIEFIDACVENSVENGSLKNSLKNTLYWSTVVYFCVLNFNLSFFIGSFNSWIKTKIDMENTDSFITFVNISLAMGCLFSPISGAFADYSRQKFKKNTSTKNANIKATAANSFLAVFFVVVMFACSLVNFEAVQYVTLVMQVFARAFMYSTVVNFISNCFPGKNFGVLYSLVECIGAVALFLQYPITLVVTRFLSGSFQEVYGTLLALSALMFFYPVLLTYKSKKGFVREHTTIKTQITRL